MIYIIGGAPRTGKSDLARKIVKKNSIPYTSTDLVFHTLKHANPSLGITDLIPHNERSIRFFPYFKEMVHHADQIFANYVIEGDCFFPSQLADIAEEYKFKACFLGFSSIDVPTIVNNVGHHNWIKELSEEQLNELPKQIMELSQRHERECEEYGYAYFDLTENYNERIEKAYNYLMNDTGA